MVDDFKWFWGAYNHGDGGFVPEVFEKGLNQEEFQEILLKALERVDDVLMMEGYSPPGAVTETGGVIPMGLATLNIFGVRIEPHFDWFWWASNRNKLECGLKFFAKYGDERFVIAIPAKSKVDRFCNHLANYGVMRHIGISHNWGEGTTVLYETRA